MGWLSGWAKRVKITVDHDDVDSALSNFPILVYLSDNSGISGADITCIFDEVGASSLKIAITESNGTTECKVEIEKWDNGNEKAWLWVKTPSINHLADTDLYIYYDSTHADNNANVGVKESAPAEAVWDDDFKYVQHMNDSGSPIKDSTDNDVDAVCAGSQVYQQAGKINDAIYLDTNDYCDTGNRNEFKEQVITLECWKKPDNYAETFNGGIAWGAIFAAPQHYAFALTMHSSTMRIYISNGVTSFGYTSPITDNDWHYWVFKYDADGYLHLYKDGEEVAESPVYYGITLDYTCSTYNRLLMGARYTGLYGFDGLYDEIRFSKVARSDSWIKATYESERDHLVNYGSEETPPPFQGERSSVVPIMQVLEII